MSHARTLIERVLDLAPQRRWGQEVEARDLVWDGLDELGHVEFLMAVEDEFDLEFTDAETEACKTFADVAALVERRLNRRAVAA